MVREWHRLESLKRSGQFGGENRLASERPGGFDCPVCPSQVLEKQSDPRYSYNKQ